MERLDAWRRLLTCCAALLLSTLTAQVPDRDTLLVDLNRESGGTLGASRVEKVLATGSDMAWFIARDLFDRRTVWQTDGTPSGTRQRFSLTDVPLPHDITGTTMPGQRLLLEVAFRNGERELQVLGAADAEPRRLLRFESPSPEPGTTFVSWHGATWFTIVPTTRAAQLWRTDGTSSGTVLVEHLGLLGAQEGPPELQILGGRLWISPSDPEPHRLACKPDPNRGTTLFRAPDGQPLQVFELWADLPSGILYVAERSSTNDARAVWRSDGTAQGTERLPGPTSTGTNSLGWVGERQGRVWFYASRFLFHELWVTDGTPAGTHLIGNRNSQFLGVGALAGPEDCAFLGNRLVFPANDGASGHEPWITDGTVDGTHRLIDIEPGAAGSNPGDFHVDGGRAWFLCGSTGSDLALWSTDGTTAGTRQHDFAANGPQAHISDDLALMSDRFVFLGYGDSAGYEPWAYVTSTQRAVRLANWRQEPITWNGDPALVSTEHDWTLMNARVEGRSNLAGRPTMFRTDGTVAGTERFPPNLPEGRQAWPIGELPLGQVFTVSSFGGDPDLWLSDGTASGTRPVASLPSNFWGNSEKTLLRFHGELWFNASAAGGLREYWKTDGTARGTQRMFAGPAIADIRFHIATEQWLVGTNVTQTEGEEPWVSAGDPASTFLLIDAEPGPGGSSPSGFARFRNGVVFTTWHAASHTIRLWYSDGTPGSATELARYDSPTMRNAEIAVSGDTAWFVFGDGIHGVELWRTDGTATGTRLVSDLTPGPWSTRLHNLYATERRLFFLRSDAGSRSMLWTCGVDSDRPRPIEPTSNPYPLENVSLSGVRLDPESIAFVATDLAHGRELWVSDGTNAGTFLLADSWPGRGSGNPASIVRLGNKLLFRATEPLHGEELHSTSLDRIGLWATSPLGSSCGAVLRLPTRASANSRTWIFEVHAQPSPIGALSVDDQVIRGLPQIGCEVLLPEATAVATFSIATAGRAVIPVTFPNDPGLLGKSLYFQAAVLRNGGPFLGVGELTGGVEVVVGR